MACSKTCHKNIPKSSIYRTSVHSSYYQSHFGVALKHLQKILSSPPPLSRPIPERHPASGNSTTKYVQAHVRSLSELEMDSNNYGIVTTLMIVRRLPGQLALELAETPNDKWDLPHLFSFYCDVDATRERAIVFCWLELLFEWTFSAHYL